MTSNILTDLQQKLGNELIVTGAALSQRYTHYPHLANGPTT